MWSDELKIYPPEKILENQEATVVIGCFPIKQVVENLRNIGCKNEFMVYPLFGAYFYIDDMPKDIFKITKIVNDWIETNKDELLSIYDLNDEETKILLTEMIAERSMEKLNLIPLERMINFKWQPYFADEKIVPLKDITLIDGGAFTGDSIEMVHNRFKNHLKKIYAFEPNEDNRNKMIKNLNELKLNDITKIIPCGMYDKDTELHFTEQSSGSKFVEDGEIKVRVKPIDSVVTEVEGSLLIKMDIEGSELAALRGAKSTIKKYNPYMAICTYHRMADILEIPKYIKNICDNYKFYLRAGFHTECYAIPKT